MLLNRYYVYTFSGDPYCPVELFKIYSQKRPEDMNSPEKSFYLGINRHRKPEGSWYIKAAMGKNSVGDIAKNMSLKAGLSGRYTNHSGRKTAVTTLVNENIPVNEIMQLTGHKNVKSINDYSSANMQKQQHMSSVLSSITKPNNELQSTLRAIENFENSTVPESVDDNQTNFVNSDLDLNFENQIAMPESNTSLHEVPGENNNLNLPILSSPGGRLSVQFAQNNSNRFQPQSIFQGCTFNAPISITMNPK